MVQPRHRHGTGVPTRPVGVKENQQHPHPYHGQQNSAAPRAPRTNRGANTRRKHHGHGKDEPTGRTKKLSQPPPHYGAGKVGLEKATRGPKHPRSIQNSRDSESAAHPARAWCDHATGTARGHPQGPWARKKSTNTPFHTMARQTRARNDPGEPNCPWEHTKFSGWHILIASGKDAQNNSPHPHATMRRPMKVPREGGGGTGQTILGSIHNFRDSEPTTGPARQCTTVPRARRGL